MIGTLYIGMSGMLAYSKGLDVIGQNVSNLNTPGYKANDVIFRDLVDQQRTGLENSDEHTGNNKEGRGVTTNGTLTRFTQGDLQNTGNATDLAIQGNGLFILRDQDAEYYTRAGQFRFNDDGYLVDNATGARVAGIENGSLVDINISDHRTSDAQATTEIQFQRNLSPDSATHKIENVQVYDQFGNVHQLTINFTVQEDLSDRVWIVEVRDSENRQLNTITELKFSLIGSPQEEFNEIPIKLIIDEENSTEILLKFGEPNSFSDSTSIQGVGQSDLRVSSQNGFALGSIVEAEFSRNGTLEITYSNGQTKELTRIALGWTNDLQQLLQIDGGLFLAKGNQEFIIAAPGDSVMGQLQGGSIEISNIELTQEFTDLIIMQRGYQASSQMVSVANEMIQQLLELGKGR